MTRYHGSGGVVYLSTSGSGKATSIIVLREWNLNQPTDKANVTGFGDTNQLYVQGIPDCTGSLSGWWDSADDNLYDASRSSDGMNMYLYPTSLITTKYWYGTAWVDFSITASVDAPIGISGNWAAKGTWGQY